MSEDNIGKDEKGYSFIQEQIASKKKCKMKKMLYSVTWTIVLASVFGVVAGVTFCISEPTISKILGKSQDKKNIEFPTTNPEEGGSSGTPGNTPATNGDGQNTGGGTNINNTVNGENKGNTGKNPQTVVIEKYIKGNLEDLESIHKEIRNIADDVGSSMVHVTSIVSKVDIFNNEVETTQTVTGLVVADNDADLLILVTYDKIKGAKDLRVSVTGSVQMKAKLQDYDSDLNLAVLAVALKEIPKTVLQGIKPANLGESYSLIVGTPIIALGSPNGFADSMETGIISSKGSSAYITDNKIDLFNTDINFNENSDGIIVNLDGEVIGIITNTVKDQFNPNVSTVIGISKIKKIIESLVNQSVRSYFGIKGADMTEAALKQEGIANGICVTEVETDSPALEGGLQSGDMILTVNDTPVISVNTFASIISAYEPKKTIKVTVRRTVKGEPKDVDLQVELGRKH